MHFLLKGISGKMIRLTFDQEFSEETFNIYHTTNRCVLSNARRCVLWAAPSNQEWPKAIFEAPSQLKCAEILSFVRLYAIPALGGFHRNVYDVWTRLGKLASQLMFEGAVPVAWMEQEVAREVRAFLESFQVLCILLTVSHAD